MFKNPFSFEGRIRRLEYGLTILIYYAYLVIVMAICGGFNTTMNSGASGLMLILIIPGFWFAIAQGVKRCHDRGNSGWWMFIPFYGLWMLFADGDYGMNEYGPNPKGNGNVDEIDQIGNYLSPE